jgi:hypothetical protein
MVLFVAAPILWRAVLRALGVAPLTSGRPLLGGRWTEMAIGRAPAVASVLAFAILTAGLAYRGPRDGGDTSRYLDYGRRLWRISPASWFADPTFDAFAVTYFVPNLIIGGAERLFGPAYALAVVLLNIIFFSLIVLCCFKVWHLEWKNARVGHVLVGLTILLGCSDVVLWNYYVLSDVTFLLFVALFWFYLFPAAVENHRSGWWSAFAIALVSALVRPIGIFNVAFWFVARWYKAVRPTLQVWIGVTVVPFVVAAFVWPSMLYLKSRGVSWAAPLVSDELFRWYQIGAVVCNRPETYLQPPVQYLDYVHITVYKLFYFFFPFRGGYSSAHNLMLALYFPLLLWLALSGWRRLTRLGQGYATLAALLGLFSYYSGLFHSMSYVDYDWRYQVPAMLSAWLLAGLAMSDDRPSWNSRA